jgi:hypothetical protein
MCLLALALAAGALLSWYARGEPLRSGVAPVGDAPSVQSSAKSRGGGVPRRFCIGGLAKTRRLRTVRGGWVSELLHIFEDSMFKRAGSPCKVYNDTRTWNV